MSALLPQNWVLKRLGEISSNIQYGYTEKAKLERVGPKFLRITDIQNDSVVWSEVPFCEIEEKVKSKYLLGKNDFVFARTGATVGKSFLITGTIPEAVFASYLIRVRLRPEVEPKFISYFFRSSDYWRQISESQAGIGQPNVNGKKLAQIKIPLAPFDQQKIIVAEIEKQFSRLDEAVSNLKRIKANLKRYKAAVLKAAVEGKLTADWRKAHPNVEPATKLLARILTERRAKRERGELPKMKGKGRTTKGNKWEQSQNGLTQISSGELEDLPSLPTHWAYIRLGVLIKEPKYGTSKKCDYETEGIGVLRIPNIVNGFIVVNDLKFAEFDKNELETYKLKEGDILTIRSNGSVPLVGKCALVTKLDEKYLYAGYLIKIRPLPELILSKYLMICFSSLLLRKQIEAKAKSTSGVNNINSGELQSLIFPFCGKEEQKAILKEVEQRLSVIDKLESVSETNLTRAGRLRQSVLEKAFSGRLVPTDPIAESASVLLSRIYAEGKEVADKTKIQQDISRAPEKEAIMADLIETLRRSDDWLKAQDAFRLCGVSDGADTDAVEQIYAELRECIHLEQIEVERRGEQDWLRLVESKGG